MWLINKVTGEVGWHICQENQKQVADLLVFVKEGGAWRTKLWASSHTSMRAKTHSETLKDDLEMKAAGFKLGWRPHSDY
jgi:hypothetical protein